MRVLIDECVHPRVREAFINHDAVTVIEAGWGSMPDHEVVRLAQGNFEAFVTIDRGFEFEHDLRKLTFGIVILHVAKNRIDYYRALFAALVSAVETIGPGQVIHVRA